MPSTAPSPPLEHQLADVKDLYAQLFLLLEQSLAEEPLEAPSSPLDAQIEALMGRIDGRMSELGPVLRRLAQSGRPADRLDAAVADFRAQLTEGLQIMSGRLLARLGELACHRDQLSRNIQLNLRKQTGTRAYGTRAGGYAGGAAGASLIMESRA